MLTANRQDRQNVAVLVLSGNLDALTASTLKSEVELLVGGGSKACVLDMTGVVLVDSSGIGAIIALFKRLRAVGGDLKVAGVAGQPKEIFDLLRLERALDLHPNVDVAARMFAK